jgi:hypothetical protein
MNRKYYIKFFQTISNQDKARNFNFTAGHLGAFSNPFIVDRVIAKLIINKKISAFFFLHTITRIIFLLILSIVPLKNLTLFIRALLRKILNKKLELPKKFLVVSVGAEKAENDPYLSKILLLLKSDFDYFKIVGGTRVKNSEFIFFEQVFGLLDFIKIFSFIFFNQYLAISSLFIFLFSKKSMGEKFFYINYCLEEIISGALYNNYLLDLFGKRIKKYDRYKKLVFPMEGRNWEKKIISNLNKSKCKTIGIIHCATTPRHLSLTSKMFYDSNEVPSIVMTPSTMAYNVISKVFTSAKVIKGSFIRGTNPPSNLTVEKNSIVFALTSNFIESKMIIKSILDSNLQNRYKIEIRLNKNTRTFKKIKKIIDTNNLILFTSFSNNNTKPLVCLFRSSSTAIEYLRIGVNPIYICLNSGFSNNIFDLDNTYNFNKLDIDDLDIFSPTKVAYSKNKCIEISNHYLKKSTYLTFMKYIN